MTAGIEKHRPASERDSEIAELHALARAGGTTLRAALEKYIAMENALRDDPIEGLEQVFRNLNIHPTEWAWRYLAECRAADEERHRKVAEMEADEVA